ANVERRHLPAGQRAALRLVSATAQASDRALREERRRDAARGRSEKARGNRQAAKNSGAHQCAPLIQPVPPAPREARKVAAMLAASAGVSTRTMEQVAELRRKAPESFAAVAAGTKELTAALKEVKRAAVV